MINLKKIGLSLLIASAVPFISQASIAEVREFNLTFSGTSKISTVVSNAVVRGDRDRYYFKAKAGQPISLAITSLEDNAVFQLSYQQGGLWQAIPGTGEELEARVWYGVLPPSQANQYRIDVGGTRGNATYDLFVGISAVSY